MRHSYQIRTRHFPDSVVAANTKITHEERNLLVRACEFMLENLLQEIRILAPTRCLLKLMKKIEGACKLL
jgi:hypothetical protein